MPKGCCSYSDGRLSHPRQPTQVSQAACLQTSRHCFAACERHPPSASATRQFPQGISVRFQMPYLRLKTPDNILPNSQPSTSSRYSHCPLPPHLPTASLQSNSTTPCGVVLCMNHMQQPIRTDPPRSLSERSRQAPPQPRLGPEQRTYRIQSPLRHLHPVRSCHQEAYK